MRWGLEVDAAGPPSPAFLAAAVEELTRLNTAWFLDQWQQGRNPPCCLGCAGTRYVPDRPSSRVHMHGAAAVLSRGRGSCHSVAAYEAAAKRAKAIRAGQHPEDARRSHFVVLTPQHRADAPDGYYHALVHTDGVYEDPTKELDR
jgi:hypothetical protein